MRRAIHTVSAICTLCVAAGCATTLRVTSEPPHAVVVTAKAEKGPFNQWRVDDGKHITPSEGKLKHGDYAWVSVRRDGHLEASPKFVRAEKWFFGKIDLDFTLTPTMEKVQDRAKEEAGVVEFRGELVKPETRKLIPFRGRMVDPFEEGLVKNENGEWIEPVAAKPAPHQQPPAPAPAAPAAPPQFARTESPALRPVALPGGITADGYAAISGNDMPAAREAAIQDALVRALEQKVGITVTSSKASSNYMLREYRVRSSVSGAIKTYNVLGESRENGVYKVTVQALFRDDVVRNMELDKVSVQIVLDPMDGVEDGMRAGTRVADVVTRRLVSDGFRVLVPDEDMSQVDLLISVYGEGRKVSTFGGLTTYSAEIHGDVTRLHAMDALASVVASGRGSRKLTESEARDAAFDERAEELATKLSDAISEKFARASFHRLTVFGVSSQGRADLIASRLREIPGVKAVRLSSFDKYAAVANPLRERKIDRYNPKEVKDEFRNEAHFEIDMAPTAIETIVNKINRLSDLDIIVLSSDRSKTYARAY